LIGIAILALRDIDDRAANQRRFKNETKAARSFSLPVVIKRAEKWHCRRHRFATFAGLPDLVFIFDNV